MIYDEKFLEQLSAYIDGELSDAETGKLEEQIALSAELRAKLNELRAVQKAVTGSVKELPESPYFETRLFAKINKPTSVFSVVKRFSPVIGIAAVTICLMLIFKFYPNLLHNIVEEQRSNLAGFYKENLRPLLYASDISNEDIFNFAFYHQLPLNKTDNQYLHLGYDPSGNEYFEIKNASLPGSRNNLQNFVDALDLDLDQQQKVDSILEAYSDDLQMQVLVNDKNTVAINPNIWNFNKAIVADLLAFAETANRKEFAKIVPTGLNFVDNKSAENIVQRVKESKENQYIFVTEDSIFSEPYHFDSKKYNEEMVQMKKELKEADYELKKLGISIKIDSNFARLKHFAPNAKDFHINIDSNMCRVNISGNLVPDIHLPDYQVIAKEIERATRNFQEFSITIPDIPKGKHSFNFRFKDENGARVGVDINMDSIMKNIPFVKPPKGNSNGYRYELNMDSIFTSLKGFMSDSVHGLNQKEFKLQMKELEKELRRFREEMKEMKKEFKKENIQVDEKAPIEI